MILKLLLPLLALSGGAFAAWTVAQGSRPAPVAAPAAPPAKPPFEAFLAGSGLLEAASQNLAIGSPLPRVAAEVLVKVGDEVAAGAPLFRLEGRDLEAELETRRAAALSAKARLERLRAAPRPEELPPAEARVGAAEAAAADLRNQVRAWEAVADRRAVTEEDLQRRRFGLLQAEARLAEARSALALLKAGAWKPDLAVAEAELASAEAQVRAVEIELSRLVVRAPVKGVVLQLNLRAGEFAPAGAMAVPLLLFGALDRLHLRVDIDENDAWRFRPGARAVAFVRGNRSLKADLRFERVEPYVLPKRSLTGESTERVDTRVLQAVYSLERGAIPVYVGQQMDVFVEATKP
jgi:multidrug resistance efflux pump